MLKIKKLALLAITFITCQLSANLDTELIEAAENGETIIVLALLDLGADVNATDDRAAGNTPLIWAAHNGYTETVRVLLRAGADVNKVNNYDWPALTWAIQGGHTETVKALLNAGANINADNLITSAFYGRTEIVKALLVAGKHIDMRGYMGRPVLMVAAINGRTETAKALLGAGVDVNIIDYDGNTACKLAAANGHTEIVALLENYINLQQQASGGHYSNESLADILSHDYAPLLRYLLSSEIVANISEKAELKALIKPYGFIAQLLEEYKEKFKTLWLTSRTEEAFEKSKIAETESKEVHDEPKNEQPNSYANMPTEIIGVILQYAFNQKD